MKTVIVGAAMLALVAGPVSAQSSEASRSGPPVGSQRDQALAQGLVRIAETAIARENNAAIDACFSPAFVIHAPSGDRNLTELKADFAALRAAFSKFRVRREIVLVRGDFVAARTTMTGIFTGRYTASYGVLAPNGRPMERRLTNFFRYDKNGKLAEGWL